MRSSGVRVSAALALSALLTLGVWRAHSVAQPLNCGPFATEPTAAPTARDDPNFVARMAAINQAVKQPYNALFLGDSLTQRWTSDIWQKDFAPLGVVNAGIDGDRTEHLLWRLDHGNLDGVSPKVVVILIGTNDLGHGREPQLAAEGVRANLVRVRQRLPHVPIVLLGLLPRSDRFGRFIRPVNRRVQTCDGGSIEYVDIGRALLDHGQPGKENFIDGVHLTDAAYAKISQRLKPVIETLVTRPQ